MLHVESGDFSTICLNVECDCLEATRCCNFWTGRRIHMALFCTTSSTHCWSVCLCCTSIGGFWCGAWLSSKFKTVVKFPKTSDQVHIFPQAVYCRNTYNQNFKQLSILQWHHLFYALLTIERGFRPILALVIWIFNEYVMNVQSVAYRYPQNLTLGSHKTFMFWLLGSKCGHFWVFLPYNNVLNSCALLSITLSVAYDNTMGGSTHRVTYRNSFLCHMNCLIGFNELSCDTWHFYLRK